MTVLVTGGAGYIGSHTVRALLAAGRDVVVLDSLELGHRAAALDAPLVVGDIGDEALVRKVCADHGVTQAIHFAAYKSVGESMQQPAKYWTNNVGKSAVLFEALAGSGVEGVVFSSSCSVYGTPERVPVGEDAAIQPESVYAETKAMAERILRWTDATRGMRSVSLRYFNAAGASADARIGEDWRYSINLVPVVMKAMLGRSGPVQVFGDDYPTPDGTAIRDYIHVDDLAAAHLAALDLLARGGETAAVNVGTGTGSSVLDIIRAAERITGQAVPYEIVGRRAGDPVESYADVTGAERLLGWRATRGLDEIIASAWEWHRSHPDGYTAG